MCLINPLAIFKKKIEKLRTVDNLTFVFNLVYDFIFLNFNFAFLLRFSLFS